MQFHLISFASRVEIADPRSNSGLQRIAKSKYRIGYSCQKMNLLSLD